MKKLDRHAMWMMIFVIIVTIHTAIWPHAKTDLKPTIVMACFFVCWAIFTAAALAIEAFRGPDL